MLAAACAPADGVILEIGSFKGRSTVALARVAKHYGLGPVISVDPHTAPSRTDPSLGGQATSFDDFMANLRRASVDDAVEVHRVFSHDLARSFARPIRLFWVDGDHTIDGARADIRLFRERLSPGAIVVMHDVLGTWEGPLRVFIEDLLECDDFGPAGFCGSIGWAQWRPDEGGARRFRLRRTLLALPARQLVPVAASGRGLVGRNNLRYKFWRPLAPHGEVNPGRWAASVALPPARPPSPIA